MSREATRLFEKFAKREGVLLDRGHYGELLQARSRWVWFIWFSGWKARQKVEKKRRERRDSASLENQ